MTYSPFSTAEYPNSKVTVIQKDAWSVIFVIFPHTQVPCMAVRVVTISTGISYIVYTIEFLFTLLCCHRHRSLFSGLIPMLQYRYN